MTKLVWGSAGDRVFQAGIDRGVLFLPNEKAVPWNGIVSVSESPDGGTTQSYYMDGVKYLQYSSPEEYSATLEAYTYPPEFEYLDGTALMDSGLQITNQRRQEFSLCYRTGVGNDTQGMGHGYKIHFVYNILAAPTNRAFSTLDNSLDASRFSWKLSTRPIRVPGYLPSSHFVIDTRLVSPDVLERLERYIYGTDASDPRIVLPWELSDILGSNVTIQMMVRLPSGEYAMQGVPALKLVNHPVLLPGEEVLWLSYSRDNNDTRLIKVTGD